MGGPGVAVVLIEDGVDGACFGDDERAGREGEDGTEPGEFLQEACDGGCAEAAGCFGAVEGAEVPAAVAGGGFDASGEERGDLEGAPGEDDGVVGAGRAAGDGEARDGERVGFGDRSGGPAEVLDGCGCEAGTLLGRGEVGAECGVAVGDRIFGGGRGLVEALGELFGGFDAGEAEVVFEGFEHAFEACDALGDVAFEGFAEA